MPPSGSPACAPRVFSASTAAALVRRVRDLAAAVGWSRACLLAPRWLVHRRYLVYASDLSRPQTRPAALAGLRVSELDDAGADAHGMAAVDPALTAAEVARRRAEGQRCLLGWWGDALAHCRWESERPTGLPYLGRVLRPLPGDQVLVDVFTAPRFRGHGIASAVMLTGMERARRVGCTRLVWLAAEWNAGSTGMRAKVDRADPVGVVERWGIGPMRRFTARGLARFDADGCLIVDRERR